MVLRTILFILLMTKNLRTHASGFDAYSSCYRTSRKRQELPCDFGLQTWCNIPGNSYPWHAVRRFVHENQGLMRRMYGDERHLSVLRAELSNNDVEFSDNFMFKEEFRRRYSKDIDRTKEFVKILINSDNKKLFDESNARKMGKVTEKFKKSIEDTSNNVLYSSHYKESKNDEMKTSLGNKIGNKTTPKTFSTKTATPTNIPTTSPSTLETTFETFTSGTTVNYKTATTMTTTIATKPENVTDQDPTDPTVTPTTREDETQYNLTTSTLSFNDSQYDEIYEYDSETEEPPTTVSLDLSTSEAYIEEEDFQRHKSENDKHVLEETKPAKEEVTSEAVSPEPSPVIRLKGINACPVKEEVVAPFWANNTRGEVLALLNLYPFEQYVHWEKCMYEHKQMFCREGCRCEQQYRLHRLLAYDPNNECRGIFSDWFRFPSCCVCKCYDLPLEFRLTSRSPRFQQFDVSEKSSSQGSSPESSFSSFKEFAHQQRAHRLERQP